MTEETKEFLEFIRKTRQSFCRAVLSKKPNNQERVEIENLLIAYDQMAERLRIKALEVGVLHSKDDTGAKP